MKMLSIVLLFSNIAVAAPIVSSLDDVIPPDERAQIDAFKQKKRAFEAWPEFSEIDWRKFDTPIVSQYRGDCTAQGLSSAASNLLRRTNPAQAVSQESLWSTYKRYAASTAINSFSRNLVMDARDWPFGKSRWWWWNRRKHERYTLAKSTYFGADSRKALAALRAGSPLYIAMSVPKGMASCKSVITAADAQPTGGGHAMAIVGARNVGGDLQWLLKQSWGTGCADRGYVWMSDQVCQAKGMYCVLWSVDKVEQR